MILNLKAVLSTLGALVSFLGLALLLPMAVGLLYGEAAWWSFGLSALLAFSLGGTAWYFLGGPHQSDQDLGVREGFAIVALAWFVLSLIGALPFVLGTDGWLVNPVLPTYTDAFFETMSGFTTTGATVFMGEYTSSIEVIPNAHVFWRSLTHWLGGMGIIVLTLAILPILGVGGMQLFKAEVPGPSADKLTPRVRETAKRLWLTYVGITIVEVFLLLPEIGLFSAVNHAFSTMATGGFSPLDESVGGFNSAYVEWVICVFMFLAGVNFALHYRLFSGRETTVFRDTGLRVYTGIILVATTLITVALWAPTAEFLPAVGMVEVAFEGHASFLVALREATFQALAIITTTGFATADYELWPPLAIGVIFLLFFSGGMAGSTGGGIKTVRHILLVKNSYTEIKQLIHPRAILPVRHNGSVVPDDVMRNVISFVVLYFALSVVGTAVMALLGLDLLSALGATLACVGNIGPAWGTFGPAENYAHVPLVGKWVLAFLMMAGRLEIFTVLILFVPTFWRR